MDTYLSIVRADAMQPAWEARHGCISRTMFVLWSRFSVYGLCMIGTQQDLNRERKCTRLRDDSHRTSLDSLWQSQHCRKISLKAEAARFFSSICGTAEAVPFQNLTFTTGC